MSRNDSTAFFTFLVGIGVGAAAVILLGSKRIDQFRDDLSEILHDGLKELGHQAQKTVNTARQRMQEAINIGADAYNEAQSRNTIPVSLLLTLGWISGCSFNKCFNLQRTLVSENGSRCYYQPQFCIGAGCLRTGR